MGFIFSKILEFFSRSRNKFKIILLGIQNAGKTTILYRLSIGQLVKTTPTIGSNVEEISYNNIKLQAWDLGGQESSRSMWEVYYTNTDAIIYVIDTSDETYDDSKTQFYKLLKNDTLKNAIILIYANKQDLPGAKSVSDIIQIYELDNIKDQSNIENPNNFTEENYENYQPHFSAQEIHESKLKESVDIDCNMDVLPTIVEIMKGEKELLPPPKRRKYEE